MNDTNQSISGGNPAVKPERAYGVDAYFEWYVRPQGYLMAGLFYKKIQDVLYRQTRTFGSMRWTPPVSTARLTSSAASRMAATGACSVRKWRRSSRSSPGPAISACPTGWAASVSPPTSRSTTCKVTKPEYRPDPTKPATVPARKVRLPGTSDLIYNVGAITRNTAQRCACIIRRRSAWLDGIADDGTDGGDTYWAADDEMDISARYAITKNFEIYADVSNVLNQPGRRYSEPGNLLTAAGTPSPTSTVQTIEWERFGCRYSGGVRVNF